MNHDISDILIVGGGPVGLFAAFYAGMRQMSVKIVDSLDELGGQLMALYPEKYIYDVAGFPKILAKDLAANLIEQAESAHPTLALGEVVQLLDRDEAAGCWIVTTDKQKHYAKTLLLSAGAGAFSPKKITLPFADQLTGRGVYYSVRSLDAFANKRVLVVGGGNSAVDWALYLQQVASHVTLIHRRNQFRAHEGSVKQLQESGVEIRVFCELKSLLVADDKLTGATLIDNRSQQETDIPVEAVLVQIGFSSSLGPIQHWPVTIERNGIVVDSRMQTNLPGIFAAGDVATFPGKLKLIATGFGEAATAVNWARTLIDPQSRAFPGHSSEMRPQAGSVVLEKDLKRA